MNDIQMQADRESESLEAKKVRRSLQRSLSRNQALLERVRLCRSVPEAERTLPKSGLSYFDRGTVYLKERLTRIRKGNSIVLKHTPNCAYKIGKTDRPQKKRSNELWNQKCLLLRAKYVTAVAFPLEQALHRHFDEFRIKREGLRQRGERNNLPGEEFRLSPQAVEDFKTTVAKVEHWVLIAEEARLELDIMRLEITLRSRKADSCPT